MRSRILAAACAAAIAAPAAAADFTLVVPLVTGEDNYNFQAVRAFQHHVEAQSGGRIAVDIFTGGTLCASGRECFDAMQAGLVHIFQSNFGEPSNLWPSFAVLDLPYMLRDDAVAECVFDDESFMADLRDGMLDATGNIRLMTVSNSGGWRNWATTSRPILSPEDVRGMRIRTIPAEIQQELVRQLGGAPIGISWPEVYTSLATGVVEGTKNGITDIVVMNFQDHLRHITLDGHAYMGGTWFINNDMFQSMPEDLRKIVVAGFDIIEQYLRAYPKFHEVRSYDAFVQAGGTIHTLTNEQHAAFREASSGMRDWIIAQNPDNERWVERFEEVVAACEAHVDGRLGDLIQ